MTFHFSVDDVFDAVIEQPQLLTDVHDATGANVDLYIFRRRRRGDHVEMLEEMTSVDTAFLRGRPWLRLAPHGLDIDTPPYRQSQDELRRTLRSLYEEIERRGAACTSWVRFHFFAEPYECADDLIARGVTTLLLTDKRVGSYRLSDGDRARLLEHGVVHHAGLELRRSHFRLESVVEREVSWTAFARELDRILLRHGYLAFFTHEVELSRKPVRAALWRCLEYVQKRELTSV